MIEFVQTKKDPITLSPSGIAQVLGLEQAGLDLSRVSIRVVQQALSEPDFVFRPLR